jgi:RNA polymerase sigma-70 factor, ECF subfamily
MNHLTVFAEYRAYLFAIAQRILGSAMDVEDLLQETFIRWHQTSLKQIRSPKAFLSTVLKRLCLNHLQSARYRKEESVDPMSLETTSTLSSPEDIFKDGIGPALRIMLERLSSKERVVLLLRDVFDCEYEEIAELISKNTVTCRQMLRRARQHIVSGPSRFTVSTEQLQQIVKEFARTCANGDMRGLVSALA